jgi:uncharacterized protein
LFKLISFRRSFKSKPQFKSKEKFLKSFALIYGFFCCLIYFGQRHLIFFPSSKIESNPSQYGLSYQNIWLTTNSSQTKENIHGWWIPASKPNAPVIIYFHHNAINIGANITQGRDFHKLGYSVFLIDYRGYGLSKGKFPSESQVYLDAETAWNYITQKRQISPDRIFIYGHSLGGAIAIDLATKHPEEMKNLK